ncbi:MAG: WecB/TagA/CpsF family glycosyltransferase [Gammaproteobacteria bacterium]|nr:WecB/TagA/CpsF family glycosyltransferase [Gammaproteobacteria bacterium]
MHTPIKYGWRTNVTRRRTVENVLGCDIDVLRWHDATETVLRWAARRESRYVCHCNVHAVVTAHRDAQFRAVLNHANLATPDGMPIAWLLRCSGHPGQPRIDGPDFMWAICRGAARTGEKIYLYGSTPQTLSRLRERLVAAFPKLTIVGAESPPFAEGAIRADVGAVKRINASGAQIVFVGLGCPKQEYWMARHRGRIKAVMIGVGAAFDYHAGSLRRAPPWMRRAGLEWLYRLLCEPRRLWRRYAVTNSLFALYVVDRMIRRILGKFLPFSRYFQHARKKHVSSPPLISPPTRSKRRRSYGNSRAA